jgi:hypothetical protein
MAKERNPASDVPYKMDEERMKAMKAFMELENKRIEVLEYLDKCTASFPEWLLTIHESIQFLIKDREKRNIPCNKEREILGNVGLFFTKMALSNGLISEWHRGMTAGKELTEEALSRFSTE